MNRPIYLITMSLALSCAGIDPAFSLSSDRDQPAEIVADDIEFDLSTGERTYNGNVSIVQGTLRIKCDKLIAVYNSAGELQTAHAWGNLATFRQRPDGKDTDTIGKGREIFVNEVENTLTLINQASLTQGLNTATGKTIVYNMATDKLKIKGGGGGARIRTPGADGSMVPEGSSQAEDEEPAETDGESDGIDTPKGRVNMSVSETGRSRIVFQPKSDPPPPSARKAAEDADADEADEEAPAETDEESSTEGEAPAGDAAADDEAASNEDSEAGEPAEAATEEPSEPDTAQAAEDNAAGGWKKRD